MKSIAAFLLLLTCVSAFGANPDYKSFRGSGGISIVSNPPNGTIVIDGSSVLPSSGTNATISVRTNGGLVAVASTNLNFIEGNNLFIRATNTASRSDIQINLKTNLLFEGSQGSYVLGLAPDGAFGISNMLSGQWSFYSVDPVDGDWTFERYVVAQGAVFTALNGSGDFLAISSVGQVYRTNAAAGFSNANAVYVDKNGNDTSALPGYKEFPALTVVRAKAMAVAGTTVFVNPGTYYNATNLFKDLVDWQGYNATLMYTNRTNDTGVGIFDDRWTGAVKCKIDGFSYVYSTGLDRTNAAGERWGPTNALGVVVMTNAASEVNFRSPEIAMQDLRSAPSGGALYLSNGTNSFFDVDRIRDINMITDVVLGINADGDDVIGQSTLTGVYWRRGEHHVRVRRNECKFYAVWPDSIGTDVGNLWYDSDYTFGKIYSDGSTTSGNWKVWPTIKELRVSGTNANYTPIAILGTGKFYFIVDKVGTEVINDVCLTVAGTAEVWITSQKFSSPRRWMGLSQGAVVNADIQEFQDLGEVSDGITVDGAHLSLKSTKGVILTNATGSAVSFLSGSLLLTGTRITTTNSSGSPIVFGTNGAVLSGCTLVAKTTSFAVGATASVSANLQGVSSNTAETNTFTYNVGPWTIDSNVR